MPIYIYIYIYIYITYVYTTVHDMDRLLAPTLSDEQALNRREEHFCNMTHGRSNDGRHM